MAADKDEFYMRKALVEARKGIGKTSPNPCVGSVVVIQDEIVGKGWHRKAGTPHAEVHALADAGEKARGATIYVTLEPCNHTGRTPPCSRAIEIAGIKRVVVGMQDPNPLVSGSGIRYLQDKGVEVVCCILEAECRQINRPFIKHITTGLPWVIMKAGMSLDGRISYEQDKPGAITGKASLRKVHLLRNVVDAILIGCGTARIDDPSLTTRLAGRKGLDPVRVILDTHLSLPDDLQIFHLQSSAPTWIFCGPGASPEKVKELNDFGVTVFSVDLDRTGSVNLHQVFQVLGEHNILSVLVEGGATVHGAMLRNKLADYVNLFVAPVFIGDNGTTICRGLTTTGKQDGISIINLKYSRCDQDIMISGEICYPE